jgi:hypothetical protein
VLLEPGKFLERKNLISHVGMGKMQVCFWLCVFCIAEKLRCVEKALRRIELQKIHKPSDNDIVNKKQIIQGRKRDGKVQRKRAGGYEQVFKFCPPTQTGGDWYRTGP